MEPGDRYRRARDEALVQALGGSVRPLSGAPADLDPLVELAGGARVVCIGEATHGTHEFYRQRALITRRLILEKGFKAVAVEGDWPDAYRVNRYVRGYSKDGDAVEALGGFERFPAWMWRNADVLDFVGWLRSHNEPLDPGERVGFYGLDLYSLHASMGAVLAYLDRIDPEAASRARRRYACFEPHGEDPQEYGYATSFGLSPDCEQEVVAQLVEMQRQRQRMVERGGGGAGAADDYFHAEQNARVVLRAEEYYRTMFRGRVSSWNLRDLHMAETLDAILGYLGAGAKAVVWAHNSHVGDARATEMGQQGELNIGQLTRQQRPSETILIGFSTYTGTVTAASDWGAPAERKRVRPGMAGSYEALFHQVGVPGFSLVLRDLGEAAGALREDRLQRAIGVIYRPETERRSHYFHASLPSQFDAILHIDHTRALEPLERTARWDLGELPETYPTGM